MSVAAKCMTCGVFVNVLEPCPHCANAAKREAELASLRQQRDAYDKELRRRDDAYAELFAQFEAAKREAERLARIETVPLGVQPKLRVFVCAVHGIGYAFGCSVTAKSMPGALKALRRKLKAEKRQGVEQITIKLTDAEPQV